MKNSPGLRPSTRIFVLAAAAAFLTPASLLAETKPLFSFESAESVKSWTSVNDGVMGGVSKGGVTRSEQGTLVFAGELSLENNGGFTSIRSKPAALNLAGMSSLVVKAKGDGRTYWIDLRVNDQMAASSYRAYLPTAAGEWQEYRVPFSDFKLQAFGRELALKPLDPAAVASVGFTLADKKAGPFQLEIESVQASPEDGAVAAGTIVDVAKAAGGFKTLLAAATAADLAGVLAGEGPFTVLAPSDEAFAKLPEGTLDELLKPENAGKLAEILKLHVIPGRVTLAKALEAGKAATLQGSTVAIRFDAGRILAGPATLVKADIAASNGIIHVIDQVLLPAGPPEPLTPVALIELAVERGVPLFNKGNAEACAALYEITCEALRTTPGVPAESRTRLTEALQSARSEDSPRKQAWILRGAMDNVWGLLREPAE